MLRKTVLFVVAKKMLIVVMLCLMCNVCFAADYPKYLLGDTDYVLCDGHTGVGYYVDLTSIQLISEDEDYCIIYAEVIPANYGPDLRLSQFSEEDVEINYDNTWQYTFLYDYATKKIYMYHSEDNEDSRSFLRYKHREYISVDNFLYKWLNPKDCWAVWGVSYPAAKKAYKYLYGESFNGK